MAKRIPEIEITEVDRERLIRIALASPLAMPANGDGEWLSTWLLLMIAKLPPSVERRDQALRTLYAEHTIGAERQRRDEVRRLCRMYEAGRWRFDQHRSSVPVDYLGTRDALLFEIYTLSDGAPPLSDRRLGMILTSDCIYKRNGRNKMRFSCPD
ncbi:hypothetical protein [Rhizobium sp. RU35A]|uniref:hypothetical protein n=1 Tax=Rhizobium sp. RU35A TaxID=1907414 RepID=UPI00122C34B2|nr:hypothetical protein [Rhizobium sp. RU35A]